MKNLSSLREHGLFLAGHSKLNTTTTMLSAAIWSLISLFIIFAPFYTNIPEGFLRTFCNVFGAFLLSNAAIGTINNYLLRRSQIDETKEILTETFLTFQEDIKVSFFQGAEWLKNIENSGLKKIHERIPTERVRNVIQGSKNAKIRFLFLSFATISTFENEFRNAIENACTIEVIVADPADNALVEFCENYKGYQKNDDRRYANTCVDSLKTIQNNMGIKKECFTFKTFKAPTSIACIEIDDWCCFGILWSHVESFHGPWFEAMGSKSQIVKWVKAHIDGIITRENIT